MSWKPMPLSLLLAVTVTAPATAADYFPIYGGLMEAAPELTPVEVGNGWYLRGDVGYDLEEDLRGTHDVYSPLDQQDFSYGALRLKDGFNAGLGMGYQFNDYLRGDVTARYGRSDVEAGTDFSSNCVFGTVCDLREDASLRTWELMANAYVDLGTFAGFTPYLGGGVGAVNVKYADANATYCDTGLQGVNMPGCISVGFDDRDSWRFAYSLAAGVAYDLTQSLKLDLGYRYLNVEDGDMYGRSLDDVGLAGFGIENSDDGFERHTIQAGVRYSLW